MSQKMSLKTNPKTNRGPGPFHRAKDVFKKCPRCESPNLLCEASEVFCLYCDWNSIEVQTEARLQFQCQRRLGAIHESEIQYDRTAWASPSVTASVVVG